MLSEYSGFSTVKQLLDLFECDEPETYYDFHPYYAEHNQNNSNDCVMLSKCIASSR